LYECEIYCPILKEQHVLRVLRRILRVKRDKVAGDCRKLHNEQFHDLYSSPDIIKNTSEGG
jgi:hypothetical protein